MAKSNSTLIVSKALPVSTHPLMDFDKLYILRRKAPESIFITPLPGCTSVGSWADLFNHPIQVVVLGTNGDEVKLGVYAHPRLKFEQGPPPDTAWRQQWRADAAGRGDSSGKADPPGQPAIPLQGPEPPMFCDADLGLTEEDATDELDALAEAHYFLYQAIEALCDSHETRMAADWPRVKSGFAQCKDWLLARECRVRRLVRNKGQAVRKDC